ncbi:MAG: hypothetical protein Terrestrivirus1_229 [Terrestrivirus sp.]|uniref:Uncharacterized protein n=1 Tax=Terrestrivirus sp. TaxID=2487775 RepID=A0A3G4ZKI7_9VIRU|nr:MAG: hypothetical protein Terrestrivirus1_229 [Terrestrivirus sp.]
MKNFNIIKDIDKKENNYPVTGPNINQKDYIAMNVYLTGNPQITFSKAVYRRYTDYEVKYCIVHKCKLPQNFDLNQDQDMTKKQFKYDIPVKNKCHILHKIYLIPNNDVSFSNIKNVKIEYGNCVLANMSGVSIKNIYDHGNFINIYDTMTSGLALPVVSISSENISVSIEFHNDVNNEVVIGIKYGVFHTIDELHKFTNVAHEYLKRCYSEDIVPVNKNQKKVIVINKKCPIEGIKFVMIPNENNNIDCSINGYLKSTHDKYSINKFQCVDVIYDQICPHGSNTKYININEENNGGEVEGHTKSSKSPIEKFFIPEKNVYLLNFKHTGFTDHLQPAGYMNLKHGNKLIFVPNFTGTIHIIYREINVLRIMDGAMAFAFNYNLAEQDENDQKNGKIDEQEDYIEDDTDDDTYDDTDEILDHVVNTEDDAEHDFIDASRVIEIEL